VNSWHEKYDFDICKGFSMGKKMTQFLPDFEDFEYFQITRLLW
jgi:hypothetical protein